MYFGDYPTATKQRSRAFVIGPSVSCVCWVTLHVRNNYLSPPENSWCCYLFEKKYSSVPTAKVTCCALSALSSLNPFKRISEIDHILITFTNNVQRRTKVTFLSHNLSLLTCISCRCQDVCCFFHFCYTKIDEQEAKRKHFAHYFVK